MTRTTIINQHDSDIFKRKMLNWAKQFGIFCFLDNLHYEGEFNWLLAADPVHQFSSSNLNEFDHWLNDTPGWKFGHIPYQQGREVYQMPPKPAATVDFGPLSFFVPRILIRFSQGQLQIEANDPEDVFRVIDGWDSHVAEKKQIQLEGRLSREEYIQKINKLKEHIHRGDCYEINFCMEYFSEGAIDPVQTYLDLAGLSPNPLSALYKLDQNWLLCASPERYLRRNHDQIISQPIKGTIERGKTSEEDERNKSSLQNSSKEQAENVMIVDLVRNDLTRVCEPATVQVTELFGVYTYPGVFQMISTVEGRLQSGISTGKILQNTFPMGSMTGAPKKRVLELIDQYEEKDRGIFSGSVGYIDSEGNFDLNVVIRSLMYDERGERLSYMVGSGITWYCEAEKEWEECQVKASAIKKVLNA